MEGNGLGSLRICVRCMGYNTNLQHFSGHTIMAWQNKRLRPSKMASLCCLDFQNMQRVGTYNYNGCCLDTSVDVDQY